MIGRYGQLNDRHRDGQKDQDPREAGDRQADGLTDRQTDRQTDT